MSDSLWPHELQRARLPCPSLSPGSLFKLTFFGSVIPSNHLIFCHPLLFLPSIFPSIQIFSSESAVHIRWPKYWSFSFSIVPYNEYSRLVSFRIDGFISLPSTGLSKIFSSITFRKYQFFCSNSHICTWLLETPQLKLYRHFWQGDISVFESTI